ncbi:hypothetical protein LINGRAHAP2_LOCUS6144, partial [Linum grandiflorum]
PFDLLSKISERRSGELGFLAATWSPRSELLLLSLTRRLGVIFSSSSSFFDCACLFP